jgi:deoxyribose-phosphate aldolase
MIEKWDKALIARHIQFTNVNPELDLEGIKGHLRICLDYGFQAAMISPCWVSLAKKSLAGSGVRIATTVNFPQATDTTEMKVAVIRILAKEGAHEFDFPPNPAFLLSGMEEEYYREIAAVVTAAHEEGLVAKAMLEFGYLPTPEMKARATQLASRAGVDWVKNSSGWGKGGSPATVEDVLILKANVSGGCRVKVSGKVNSLAKMDALFVAGAELVGTSSGPAIVDGRAGDGDAY